MSEDFNPPTVSFLSPATGARVSGLVTVAAKAWDDVGVTNVQFQANGMFIGQVTESPYKILWNTTQFPNGNTALIAYAFDGAGNQSMPATVQVTVTNRVDVTPPDAKVLSPADGSTVSGIVTIRGEGTDDVGVTRLHITIDGEAVVSLNEANRISFNWNTQKAIKGRHVISVIAEDATGKIGSASVNVEVVT